MHETLVLLAGPQFQAALDLPQPQRAVLAHRRERLAVGAEGDAEDRLRVAFELAELLAARQLPDAHRVVVAPRREQLAVRRHREAVDGACVALERAHRLARGDVPESHRRQYTGADDVP